MTLEDFFTLTEMNNGLATPARVQELVAIMQKEKDDVEKSLADATRQWSAVASTIAATESKDCLELFIQLDGLSFIDNWLKNAQKFDNDSSDNSFIEESITDLLRAVDKLCVGNEKLVSSGIKTSVEKLLGHKSSKVQEMAKSLFDRCEKGTDAAAVSSDVEKLPTSVVGETTQSEPSCNEQDRDNLLPSVKSDAVQPETAQGEETSDKPLDNNINQDSSTKHLSDAHDEVETTQSRSEGTTLMETCSPTEPTHVTLHEQSENPDLVPGDGLKDTQRTDSSKELDSVLSKPLDDTIVSPSTETKDAVNSVTQPGLQGCTDAKDNDCTQETTSFDEATTAVSDRKSTMDESGSGNHCGDAMVTEADENTKSNIELWQCSSSKHNLEYTKEDENIGEEEVDEDHSDQSEDNLATDLAFGKLYMGNKDAGKKSDFDFDCGFIDPLELARQVAIEVEREVEQSSVKKTSKVNEPDSPDSASPKQLEATDGSEKEEKGGIHSSDSAAVNETHDMDSSQVTVAAQDHEANSEKGLCEFDLNQDVCSDDTDQPTRPVTALNMPANPLQFEGSTGWKGSAVTSASHPASDKAVSNAESDGSSKQQHGFLGIDLNVAETGDDQKPLSSALPSGESSDEASSKKLERVELDLNRISDEGEASLGRQLSSHQNGPQSQSPSSSSSSKQPSLRNIDLNDQPGLLNDSAALPLFTKSSQDSQSVVSIMGMRVEVNQKEAPQSTPLTNGRISDPILDSNRSALGMGSMFSYTPSLGAYTYNNSITPGPPPSFSSPVYGHGPIPYMVDFRAPVMPQIVGPTSSMPPPFPNQPIQPFFISMSGPPPTNGIVPLRSSFDLNSGSTPEAGNRDLGGLRQFLNPLQPMPMESYMRPSSQPSTSLSIGGKRKEPDGGWEPYPFNHHQPPWK